MRCSIHRQKSLCVCVCQSSNSCSNLFKATLLLIFLARNKPNPRQMRNRIVKDRNVSQCVCVVARAWVCEEEDAAEHCVTLPDMCRTCRSISKWSMSMRLCAALLSSANLIRLKIMILSRLISNLSRLNWSSERNSVHCFSTVFTYRQMGQSAGFTGRDHVFPPRPPRPLLACLTPCELPSSTTITSSSSAG